MMTDEAVSWMERFGPGLPSIAQERARLKRACAEAKRAFDAYTAFIADGMDESQADKKSRWLSACHTWESARRDARNAFAIERGWVV
jgi:hypothetical protein